jgi:hypothetical protein
VRSAAAIGDIVDAGSRIFGDVMIRSEERACLPCGPTNLDGMLLQRRQTMRQSCPSILFGLFVLLALAGALGGCSDGGGDNLAGKVPVAGCIFTEHVCPCVHGMYCLANTEACAAPETACPATADLQCQDSENVCPCYFGAYCLEEGAACRAPNVSCPFPRSH